MSESAHSSELAARFNVKERIICLPAPVDSAQIHWGRENARCLMSIFKSCDKCNCPSRQLEETVRPTVMQGGARKYVFNCCTNSAVLEVCNKCGSKMMLRTLITTAENQTHGHIRMLLCTNTSCNHKRPLLKPTGMSCPLCGNEVVEMPGVGGLFNYSCLGNISAAKLHGVEGAESLESGCLFNYFGDLLQDGPNHTPKNTCPRCRSALKFLQGDSDLINLRIVCSHELCTFRNSQVAPRRAPSTGLMGSLRTPR